MTHELTEALSGAHLGNLLDLKVNVGWARVTEVSPKLRVRKFGEPESASFEVSSTAFPATLLNPGDRALLAHFGSQAVLLGSPDGVDRLGPGEPVPVSWAAITGKPSVFPPAPHVHEWDDIEGRPTSYPPTAHTHAWGEVTGKPTTFPPATHSHGWSQITGKPTTFAPSAHTHPWAEVTGKPATFPPTTGTTAVTAKPGNWFPTWAEVSGKPGTFPPAAHVHMWDDIDGKPSVFPPAEHGHGWGDITGKPSQFPPEAHTHPWSQVTGKPTTFPPEGHTHERADITGLTPEAEGNVPGSLVKRTSPSGAITIGPATALNQAVTLNQLNSAISGIPTVVEWDDIEDKPSEFPPTSHSHTIGDVTDLQSALGSKADISHTHTWAQVTGKPTSFNPTPHDHPASEISDSSVVGRNVLTADDAATARAAIGAGTSNLALGTTASTAKAGNWMPTWAQVSGKPATFAPSAHTHSMTDISDLPGISPFVMPGTLAQRNSVNGGLTVGPATADSDAVPLAQMNNAISGIPAPVVTWDDVQNKPSAFAPSAHTHTWAQVTGKPSTFPPIIGTTAATAKAGNWTPTWEEVSGKPERFTPDYHFHAMGEILDLPTFNIQDLAGTVPIRDTAGQFFMSEPSSGPHVATKNYVDSVAGSAPSWSSITGKPPTFPPSSHSHTIAQVSGLGAALDGKVNTSSLSNRIYATASGGSDTTLLYGTTATVNYIPRRTTGGHIILPTSDPTVSTYAASKGYVDTTGMALALRISDLEADTGWVGFDSATGYSSGTGTYAPAYRIKNGIVYLKGWIGKDSGNFTTSYATVATLPSAATPSIDAGAFNSTTGSTSASASGSPFVIVNSVGNIRVAAAASPGASRVYLSGIIYPL